MKKRARISSILSTLLLAGITLVLFFPIVLTVLTSLKPPDEIITATPKLFPEHYTLENYRTLFSLREFRAYLGNSLLVAGLTALIGTMISLLASYALVWMKFPAKRTLVRSIFLTYMFPEIIMIIPLFLMCSDMNLIDSRFGLVLVYLSFSLPFSIWLLKLFFESIPVNLIEASTLDGCSDLQCMLRIALPLSLPAVTTVFVLSFVLAWDEYLYANTLILTDTNRTIAVGLQTLIGQHHVDFGLLAAAGVIMVLPVWALFLMVQKYIVRGLAVGNARQ
jgi:multiple sugar transport system permease protein